MSDPRALKCWFHVKWNEEGFSIEKSPPGYAPSQSFIAWKDIIRVCMQTAEDFLFSDDIFIFTKDRPESYVIPTEADGGLGLWDQLIRRNFFDAELAIKACSTSGELFIWPPV